MVSDRRAAVEQRILDAAEAHFLAYGFHRITMDDLAARLGMSKRTVYQHFEGKMSLLTAVLDRRLHTISRELDGHLLDSRTGFSQRMRGVLEVLQRRMAEVKPPFMLDLQKHAPEIFERIDAFRRTRIQEVFGRLLEEGRREGMVRSDLEDRLIVEALLVLVQNLVNPEAVERWKVTPAVLFDHVLGLVLQGVLTDSGREAQGRQKGREGK